MFGQILTESKINDLIINSNIYKIFEPVIDKQFSGSKMVFELKNKGEIN